MHLNENVGLNVRRISKSLSAKPEREREHVEVKTVPLTTFEWQLLLIIEVCILCIA